MKKAAHRAPARAPGRPPARGRQASPCRVGPAVTRKRSGSGSGVGAGRMAADTQVRRAGGHGANAADGGAGARAAVAGALGPTEIAELTAAEAAGRGGGADASRLEARLGPSGQSDAGLEESGASAGLRGS